jgi:YbgC/YbaW family acyl-CoA thioester hydrolase
VLLYKRPVRFDDVDAAQILFFARFFGYCHEAMEALLDGVPGGYAPLVLERRIGFPAVHVEADFVSPLRFGDVAHIAVVVEHIGKSSCRFRYDLTRAEGGGKVATIRHVCVVTDLGRLRAIPIPDDVRALFAAHLV